VNIAGVNVPQGKNVNSPTIQRRELLRPFPQFNDILMRQSTLGRSQYHAAIVKFDKRMSNGWGARINYTFSRLMDNQFGETNFFSGSPGFVSGRPAEMQDAYNLDAEYSLGLLDVPHKVAISPIVELPFGEGKRWLNGGIGSVILGDWTVSSIISLESGFPTTYSTNTNTTQIFTRVQRPDGSPADTEGSRYERIAPSPASGCVTGDCGIGLWIDGSGLSTPANFTLGTMPRTTAEVRTPHRNNWDFVASKSVRFPGRVRGQLRLEVLNLTNTVKVRSPDTRVGRSTFGQIGTQGGFMRLTQLMFRVSF
jgi:hypothetical protein